MTEAGEPVVQEPGPEDRVPWLPMWARRTIWCVAMAACVVAIVLTLTGGGALDVSFWCIVAVGVGLLVSLPGLRY